MARISPILTFQFIISSLLLSSFAMTLVSGENHGFVRSIDPEFLGLQREKLTHIRLYWHDIVGGPHPTAIDVVSPPSKSSPTNFGLVRMFDNALTQGPELSSELVARAQGFYASAAQKELSLLMAQNFAFVQGEFNGSTITLLGRNSVFNKVRELPVIGGSGVFRFARGYAEARTHTFDLTTGDATVEYNIYVLHY
ncbi:dirigent protein 22-like [Prunus yedoensis var. nudiflora]|uniref:Dirigent protein n=1 Tax=Prunus yedoensis var. nudiflora TaxID=2094558 RepID=A0A314Z2C4_PRUYE|nr:dirigent protein 22-like [Prunus yedoensis var. nudiflora]